MMLIQIWLCLCLQIFLVSANPLTLIPLQTCQCPQTNQNYYQNYQKPTNIPVLLQSNTQPQNYQQSNNNKYYPQTYTVQNQPTQNQNPVTDLNQLYLSKILSNPSVQTILDNTNLYSQLGFDVPGQINSATKNPPNGTPQVVNNYFVLPPEMFDTKDLKEIVNTNCPKRNRDDCKRDNSCNNCNVCKKPSCDSERPAEHKRRTTNHNRRSNQERPKEYRRNDEDGEWLKRRRNQAERPVNQSKERDRSSSREVLRRRKEQRDRSAEISDRSNERHTSPKQVTLEPDVIINITEMPTYEESSPAIISENLAQKEKKEEKTRKSKDDEVIEQFMKKFPGVPETVVRKLISYLRQQVQQRKDLKFPLQFDQIMQLLNQDSQQRPIRSDSSRNQHNSKPIVGTTTNVETITIPTTTEAFKTTKPIVIINVPKKSTTKEDKTTTMNSKPKENFETTTISAMPEWTTDNHEIDDYYPDFYNDNKYYDSSEVSVRNHRDNRYYYTTDRNEPTPSIHETNMEKLKSMHQSFDHSIEDVLAKPDIVVNTSNYESGEIHYHTAPSIETTGFQTKQLIRSKVDNAREIEKHRSYKSSTYSDAKTPSNRDAKTHKAKKSKKDNIETVYAHSKVVKYGKTEESQENATPVVTYYLPDNMQYQEDGKTVIIARSIPADHFY